MTHDANDPLSNLYDVPVRLSVELGRTEMPLSDIATLGPGAVVELGKSAGESLDIRVNGKLVARGEAVVVGEKYGIRIVEIVRAGGRDGQSAQTTSEPPQEKEHAA
ncbi:MAG: flagellar motor switch protein FliN [Deltaproteobacteria bacterium]|nr:MAG: flagellar motor switch protein FliN [Deltaproteobacteria bacterium]